MAIYLLAPILQVFVFTWDAQALSSDSHMKTQPFKNVREHHHSVVVPNL